MWTPNNALKSDFLCQYATPGAWSCRWFNLSFRSVMIHLVELKDSKCIQKCSYFIKFVRTETLLKKKLRQRCFPVNFPKFLRTSFLQNTFERSTGEQFSKGKHRCEMDYCIFWKTSEVVVPVLCYLQYLKNTKYVRIILIVN